MIYQLWKSGELDKFVRLGIIRSTIPRYCEMYDHYIKQREKGMNYLEAVEDTAEKLNVSDETVKKAIAEVV